jgi:hypothetical protein
MIKLSALFPFRINFELNESYREAVGPHGPGDRPTSRPLPSQANTDTKETHTGIHASSGIRPTVPVFEPSCLYNDSLEGKLNTESFKNTTYDWGQDSSVGIATGYGLDDRWVEFKSG